MQPAPGVYTVLHCTLYCSASLQDIFLTQPWSSYSLTWHRGSGSGSGGGSGGSHDRLAGGRHTGRDTWRHRGWSNRRTHRSIVRGSWRHRWPDTRRRCGDGWSAWLRRTGGDSGGRCASGWCGDWGTKDSFYCIVKKRALVVVGVVMVALWADRLFYRGIGLGLISKCRIVVARCVGLILVLFLVFVLPYFHRLYGRKRAEAYRLLKTDAQGRFTLRHVGRTGVQSLAFPCVSGVSRPHWTATCGGVTWLYIWLTWWGPQNNNIVCPRAPAMWCYCSAVSFMYSCVLHVGQYIGFT